MMKLAYFSPLNPRQSGISDYSEELLPYLAREAEIDLFVDGFKPGNATLRRQFRAFDYRLERESLARLGAYDAVVYHMGNDHRYHAGIYAAARDFPGIVVLHDFVLQTFFLELARSEGDMNIYLDELEACHGSQARADSAEMLERGGTTLEQTQPLLFPFNRRIIGHAEAVIVHSAWSRSRVAAIAPATPVAQINHHVLPDDNRRPSPVRASPPGRIEIASFGYITTEKGIEQTLRVLASLRRSYDFHYTLVGQPNGYDVAERIGAHALTDRVTVTGYVSLQEFQERIGTTDIAVNLRERTSGETSGSVCRLLAAGVPTIVSNTGWFAELPDEAVWKLDAGDAADEALRTGLRRLMEDATLRAQLGACAKRYVSDEHAIERSAHGYLTFIRDVIAQRTRRALVRQVAAEMSRLGVQSTSDELLRGVATEIARLTPTDTLILRHSPA